MLEEDRFLYQVARRLGPDKDDVTICFSNWKRLESVE